MEEKNNWSQLILRLYELDPTSAYNLHCTGCWAVEYGSRLATADRLWQECGKCVSCGREI